MAMKNIMPSRRMLIKAVFTLLLATLFENVCFGGQWTMMFYMAAHNDLYSQALTDLKELQNISGKSGIDILVQLDSPSGTYRYKVLPQGTSILASLGQSNSGSPEALADFGSWAVKTYPAQKYLLVLWDHGDGWSKNAKYIGYDQGFNDCLNVSGGELRQAVGAISSSAGQPLDVVVFDACSMQMAEVLSELNGLCNYAVGSEALFPTGGMPYDIAWKDISYQSSPESLAVSLAKSCKLYDELGYQTTCSAINIRTLSQASQGLKGLVNIVDHLPETTIRGLALIPDSVVGFPPVSSYDLTEMLDFMGSKLPEPEKQTVLDVSQQFKNSILAQTVTGGQYKKAKGLAVWYPIGTNNFESGVYTYPDLKWSKLSGWDKILYKFVVGKDSFAAVPQNVCLVQPSDGAGKLIWEPGYEPSGIDLYQVRHSQNIITTFLDQGGCADSSKWFKDGFTIVPGFDGDTAYFSNGGRMTGKNIIELDSSGSISFTAEGTWGSLVLESSPDTMLGWDTISSWNFYGVGSSKYCSADVKTAQARIRISWNQFSTGNIFIDDIRACHPDAEKATKSFFVSLPYHFLSQLAEAEGYYQVRTIDSLQNKSSWSETVFYRTGSGHVRAWPNPFKDEIYLTFSSIADMAPEVKIFNILGQYVDKMTLIKKDITGGKADCLYRWTPQKALAEGVYIARSSFDSIARSVRIILIR